MEGFWEDCCFTAAWLLAPAPALYYVWQVTVENNLRWVVLEAVFHPRGPVGGVGEENLVADTCWLSLFGFWQRTSDNKCIRSGPNSIHTPKTGMSTQNLWMRAYLIKCLCRCNWVSWNEMLLDLRWVPNPITGVLVRRREDKEVEKAPWDRRDAHTVVMRWKIK